MIKTLPAVMACLSLPMAPAMADEGAALYQSHCAMCHMDGAQGQPGRVPPLAGRMGRLSATGEGRRYVAAVLLNGMMGRIMVGDETYAGFMPAFRMLSDTQVAATLNHLARLPDGAGTAPYTAADIAAARMEKLSPPAVADRRTMPEARLPPP